MRVVEDGITTTLVRPIPGFDGYFVSNDGRVFSTKRKGPRDPRPRNVWKVARPHPRTGHPRVDLRRTGATRHTTISVHCLVAWAWIGPTPPGLKVCHADGNFDNSAPSNLYFGSDRDNSRDREYHATREGRGRPRPGALEHRDDRGFVYVPDPVLGF